MSSFSSHNESQPYRLRTAKTEKIRIAIVTSQWNDNITTPLRIGAAETLQVCEIPSQNIDFYEVPGAFELTYAAARLLRSKKYDAIIVLGCVIRGDTSHYDHICDGVSVGITRLNTEGETPVIFGLVTTENLQQALDRAGGVVGNKGSEAAITALQMIDFSQQTK